MLEVNEYDIRIGSSFILLSSLWLMALKWRIVYLLCLLNFYLEITSSLGVFADMHHMVKYFYWLSWICRCVASGNRSSSFFVMNFITFYQSRLFSLCLCAFLYAFNLTPCLCRLIGLVHLGKSPATRYIWNVPPICVQLLIHSSVCLSGLL